MKMSCNFLLAGVGGQGTILASNVLADVALRVGLDVKKSEVHGMAQRGGSVVSGVRFGDKVYSPLIPAGEADFLVAAEKLEALRYQDQLRPEGVIIVNDMEVYPLAVSLGTATYPAEIIARLRASQHPVHVVEALSLARKTGNPRTMNLVLLGVLSRFLPLSRITWENTIAARVPPKTLEDNLTAFNLGRAVLQQDSLTAAANRVR